jgi:hypothetical protein
MKLFDDVDKDDNLCCPAKLGCVLSACFITEHCNMFSLKSVHGVGAVMCRRDATVST